VVLTFGLPVSLRSDPGTEFTVKVVEHMCRWLNVPIDNGPVGHARAQGTVKRLGGGTRGAGGIVQVRCIRVRRGVDPSHHS